MRRLEQKLNVFEISSSYNFWKGFWIGLVFLSCFLNIPLCFIALIWFDLLWGKCVPGAWDGLPVNSAPVDNARLYDVVELEDDQPVGQVRVQPVHMWSHSHGVHPVPVSCQQNRQPVNIYSFPIIQHLRNKNHTKLFKKNHVIFFCGYYLWLMQEDKITTNEVFQEHGILKIPI